MYGVFTYIYHKNQSNASKYTSPMDPMGWIYSLFGLNSFLFGGFLRNRPSEKTKHRLERRFKAAAKSPKRLWASWSFPSWNPREMTVR